MIINIGKQIKALRMIKGVTQESLANEFNMSCQAISKWETGVSLPDIQLLPEIAVYFGVTIDELFKLSEEAKLDRIDNMLINKRNITFDEFERNKGFLLGVMADDPENARAHGLLSELYLKLSRVLREDAIKYAKNALNAEPDSKRRHAVFREAMGGPQGDYYLNLHYELIDFYKTFMEQHPVNNVRCRFFLMDCLLGDNRINEAEEYLEKMKQATPEHILIPFYEGDIAFRRGKYELANDLWNKGVSEYPDEKHLGYFYRASRMEMQCRYREAIDDYETSFCYEPKPRLVDSLVARAYIYEHLRQYKKAAEMRRFQVEVLKLDWGFVSGEAIDLPLREVERLESLFCG